ncbi:MAG: DUF4349 domain-containing protein, partial [Coriobacteriia bacterium]|nr:DUF4349 domain-containing protein [Coriobacteriia bacterium]
MNTRTGTARIIRGVLLTLLLAASFVLNACSFAGYEGPGESEKMQATPQASPPDETMSQNDRLSTDERVHGTPLAGAPTTEEYGDSGVDASMIPAEDRYIIRSVGMRLQVSDVDKAVQGVRTQVASAKGIITSLQVSTDENVPVYRYEDAGAFSDGAPLGAYIIARVPVSSLDSFLTDVSKLGTVQRQAEDESDVTQEHIDLTARLETFKAQEKRLREFFDRAQKVDEMLAIE